MAKDKKESVETTVDTVIVEETKQYTESPTRSKVTIRPLKGHGWLPKDHDGFHRYSKCFERLTVQNDRHTGILITGLTKEDEERLEKEMKLDSGTLSKYNKDYWGKFFIDVPKTGKELDLNIPKHELIYKVLQSHQRVANSELERFDTPFAEYVMTNDAEEAKVRNRKSKVKRDAYKKFGLLNIDQLTNVLKVHGKKVDNSATPDFIESEVDKIIDNNPQTFLNIVNDKDFEIKVFIDDCLTSRVLIKEGSKYLLPGGDIIGYDINETMDYLSNPKNQEVYLNLKGRLDIK